MGLQCICAYVHFISTWVLVSTYIKHNILEENIGLFTIVVDIREYDEFVMYRCKHCMNPSFIHQTTRVHYFWTYPFWQSVKKTRGSRAVKNIFIDFHLFDFHLSNFFLCKTFRKQKTWFCLQKRKNVCLASWTKWIEEQFNHAICVSNLSNFWGVDCNIMLVCLLTSI